MTIPIHPRELENLSAYLDGELNAKECDLVEARVEVDSDLREVLESLSHTRRILRSQPALRSPRNFTLTPEMAGLKSQRWYPLPAFSVMRLSSVLATIFLVVLTVGNLLAGRMQSVQVSQANPMQQPAFGMGGGGGGGGGDLESQPSLLLPDEIGVKSTGEVTPKDTGVEALVVTPLAVEAESQLKVPAPEEALSMEEATGAAAAIPEEGSAKSLPPVASEKVDVPSPGIPWIGLLQILLAFLAIATGVMAIYLKRSHP